jgi:hypothetical protein
VGQAGYAVLCSAPQEAFAAAQPSCQAILKSFAVDSALATTKKGKIYRHVIGFSFWHPEDWTVKEHDDFLQIVPPDQSSTADGPTELYFIAGESVAGEGITRPDDPQVIAYMDMQVKSIAPTLRRTGKVEAVPMAAGDGVAITWQGTSPRGDAITARSFTCILRDHGVSLIALGFKDRIAARDTVVRQIFASFGLGQGSRDPKLVGTWTLLSTYSLVNRSPFVSDDDRASLTSESTSVLAFRRDGTWKRTDVSRFIAFGAGITIDSGPEKTVTQGRWNAGNRALYLMWQDGTWEDYTYQILQSPTGRRLKLACGKRGELWEERR